MPYNLPILLKKRKHLFKPFRYLFLLGEKFTYFSVLAEGRKYALLASYFLPYTN